MLCRQNVVRKMPALHLPVFPGKKAFGRFEQEFLDSRYRMLNDWIGGLIKSMVPCCRVVVLCCIVLAIALRRVRWCMSCTGWCVGSTRPGCWTSTRCGGS